MGDRLEAVVSFLLILVSIVYVQICRSKLQTSIGWVLEIASNPKMGIGAVVKVHNHDDFSDQSNAWYTTMVLIFEKNSNNTHTTSWASLLVLLGSSGVSLSQVLQIF